MPNGGAVSSVIHRPRPGGHHRRALLQAVAALGFVAAGAGPYVLAFVAQALIAFLGFDSLKFTKPTKAGDTIHAKIKVLEKRETKDATRGVMKRELQVINQRGEVVQEGIQAFLLKRKPA